MAWTALFSRHQPGGMFAVADKSMAPGDVFFVNSATGTDGAGYGQNPDSPVATLDYAIGLCTASKGDTIYLMPGHAENLGGATALTMDVAGVKVVGLGTGALRPTFSITAAAGTWNITAPNCWVENVLLVGNFLNIVAAMTVGALADGLTLKNLETRDTSAVKGALIQITIAAACADVTIDGYKHTAFAGGLTAPATNVIVLEGAADRFALVNSRIYAFVTGAVVAGTAAASADIVLENIRLINADTSGGLGIAVHNSTTGFVEDVATVNLKNNVVGVTGTGLSPGLRVTYSNAVGAHAGRFCYAVDS